MSDAAVTAIVAGVVNVVGLVIGFMTLLMRLRVASSKAEEAVVKAEVVEHKLDGNTRTTDAVNQKTDTIVARTNGTLSKMQSLVERIDERVSKLENYNRESSHRLFDTINALALKVERLIVSQELAPPLPAKQQT